MFACREFFFYVDGKYCLMKVLRKGKQHAVERGNIEEYSAVGGKGEWRSFNFVRIRMNLCFGTLSISQKRFTNNWQMKCGVEQAILMVLDLTTWGSYSEIIKQKILFYEKQGIFFFGKGFTIIQPWKPKAFFYILEAWSRFFFGKGLTLIQ